MNVLYGILTAVAALYCCVGLWAALSKRHWFVRACVVLLMLSLLVPIRAYEPLVLFGLTTVVFVMAAQSVSFLTVKGGPGAPQSGQRDRTVGRYRFGLRDLLLLMGVAAAASWLISVMIAAEVNISGWRFVLGAIMLGILTAAACGAVLVAPRWRWLLVFQVAVLAATALDGLVLGDWLYTDELLSIIRDQRFARRQGLDSLLWLYGTFGAWVLTMASTTVVWTAAIRSPAIRYSLRMATLVVFVPLALLLAAIYWHMLGSPIPPAYAAQRSNALPRILELAELLPNASPRRSQEIYGELLPLLKQPGANEIDWRPVSASKGQGIGGGHASAVANRRVLARQLQAESALRQTLNQPDEAAEYALAMVRYAAMLDRNGLVLHRIEAGAVAQMAFHSLARCRTQISPSKAAEAARLLDAVAAEREPLDATMERDHLWNNLSMGWRYRFERAIGFDLWGRKTRSVRDNTLAVLHQRVQCLADLLTVDLALRAYRGDHGSWPESLEELSPRYLKAVPLDRYSDRPFIYRPAGPEFVLYSVGRGGVDDGGKFAAMRDVYPGKVGLDLDVDTLVRP